MLFAMTAEQHFFGMLTLFFLGLWGFKRFMGKFDTDGSVKDAARKGLVNQIGKWLK